MKAVVAEWLSKRFKSSSDTKRVFVGADSSLVFQSHVADCVIQTWMGARIYVYLIDHELRMREFRQILKENSRYNIGTLFVLDGQLLPADGSTQKLDNWIENLLLLDDSAIYSYFIDGETASLRRVNFTNQPELGHYYTWYSGEFTIEAVNVRKRNIENGFKGTWYLADIASPNYKRQVNHERINQRHHYRTKNTRRATFTPQEDERLQKYCTILNVKPNATEEQVKTAYRNIALRVHPDVSALPQFEADRRFKELQEAYDFFKEINDWT